MYQAIKQFNTQFGFKPAIVNKTRLKKAEQIVLVGMGGSALAGHVLQSYDPTLAIAIHKDYGLPQNIDLKKSFIILSSYSGNTEEVLSALDECIAKKLNCAAISVGGKLLERAAAHKLPYIRIPDTGIQPRSALGFSTAASAAAVNHTKALRELRALEKIIDPAAQETAGKLLAEHLKDHVAVIYASERNLALAYNWKIKLNETGKNPAFYNVIPELNHNEMTGFDVVAATRHLSSRFRFFLLQDSEDSEPIVRRMEILAKLYGERGLAVEKVPVKGSSRMERIFSSLVLADWLAYYTAQNYGVEAEQVPMVEQFKKLIA